MVPTPEDSSKKKPRRSDGSLLTLKAFVLLLVGTGVVLLGVHDPRWAGAVLCGVTVLAFLAKMINLCPLACGGSCPPHARAEVEDGGRVTSNAGPCT